MRVRILKEFRDKDNFAKVFYVSTEAEFDDVRAMSLISRGLVEAVVDEAEVKVDETEVKTEAEDTEVKVDETEEVQKKRGRKKSV